MDMIDPAIDMMEFIALLAGVCTLCFKVIIPLTKEINEVAYIQNYDKTVSSLKGEKPLSTEDGCYSAEEIAQSIASQSTYLVSPISVPYIEDDYIYQYSIDEIATMVKNGARITRVNIPGITNGVEMNSTQQYNVSTVQTVYNAIANWYNNTHAKVCKETDASKKNLASHRFKVMFSMGTSSTVGTNVYQLYYYENGEFKKCE